MDEGMKKLVAFGILALLAVAIVAPETFQGLLEQKRQEPQLNQKGAVDMGDQGGEDTTIYAISSVSMNISAVDELNETRELINPTFRLWREDATQPTTVSISNGKGSASLSPGERIQWAAGSDGSLYWKKASKTMGNADTPLEVSLYSVASSGGASVQVFDTSFNDLSQGCTDLSGTNKTLTVGEDTNLELKVDTTGEYTAVRSPHICVAYNDSVVQDVDVSGLTEVDAPTRIISGLDQCFDTGVEYLTDSKPSKTYSVSVDIVSGVDPFFTPTEYVNESLGSPDGGTVDNPPIATDSETVYSVNSTGDSKELTSADYNIAYCDGTIEVTGGQILNANDTYVTYTGLDTNSKMDWYIVDKDLYWKDGQEYFINPIDNSNMGSTYEWNVSTRFK